MPRYRQLHATPIFSPGGGTYTSAQSVTITSSTSGASIRYTTDGSPHGFYLTYQTSVSPNTYPALISLARNDLFPLAIGEEMQKSAKKRNLDVVMFEKYSIGTMDHASAITQMRAAKPDLIFAKTTIRRRREPKAVTGRNPRTMRRHLKE